MSQGQGPQGQGAAVSFPPEMRIPAGVPLSSSSAPQFPPEVAADLLAARKSGGRWLVAVAVANEKGDMNVRLATGEKFSFDWLLRAFKQIEGLVLRTPLPGAEDFVGQLSELLAMAKSAQPRGE